MRTRLIQSCLTGIGVLGGPLTAPAAPGQSALWCGSSLTAKEAELVRALEAPGVCQPPERPLDNHWNLTARLLAGDGRGMTSSVTPSHFPPTRR